MEAIAALEQRIRRLRRRLVVERALFGAALLGAGAAWLYPVLYPTVWAIHVDGRPLVAVEERSLALSIARRMQERGEAEATPIAGRLRVAAADPDRVRVVEEAAALAEVSPALGLGGERGVICVQGAPVAALPTAEEAEQVLDALKARFAASISNLEAAPEFTRAVTVRREVAPRPLWCADAAEAARWLLQGRPDPDAFHTPASGETAADVAALNGLDLPQLRNLNPGVALETLRADTPLRVRPPSALTVAVVTVGEVTEEKELPPTSVTRPDHALYVGKRAVRSPGRPGRVRVVARVRCENGREVGREVVEQTVIQPAQPQVVAVGALPRPQRLARQ